MSQGIERVCRDCEQRFTVDVRWYAKKGFSPPVRCGDCRRVRRQARIRGVVQWFDVVRGHGEIAAEPTGRLYFVTRDDVVGQAMNLRTGMRVKFLPVESGRRGPRAYRVDIRDGEVASSKEAQ